MVGKCSCGRGMEGLQWSDMEATAETEHEGAVDGSSGQTRWRRGRSEATEERSEGDGGTIGGDGETIGGRRRNDRWPRATEARSEERRPACLGD